jgi:hypothetical protein
MVGLYASTGTNANITSLTGLTTPLSVGQGGTGANLSTTGGANQIVKQGGVNSAFTVGSLTSTELPADGYNTTYVDVTGDTMTGALTMSAGATLTGLPTPTLASDATPKSYVDAIIPVGLIAIFTSAACPAGWTRVTAFDGVVLRGSSASGATGGATIHLHAVDPASAATSTIAVHDHTVNPLLTTTTGDGDHSHDLSGTIGVTNTVTSITHVEGTGVLRSGADYGFNNHDHSHSHSVTVTGATNNQGGHTHGVDIADLTSSSNGSHNHTLDLPSANSTTVSSWPPYIEVLFCSKN